MKIPLLFLALLTSSHHLTPQTDVNNQIVMHVLTSKSQSLYSGIDNYFTLQPSDKYLVLQTDNGTIRKVDTCFSIFPESARNTTIKISAVLGNDTVLVSNYQFLVRSLPFPTLKIGSTPIKEKCMIDRNKFLNGDSLTIFFDQDILSFDRWYRIKNFNIGYLYGNNYLSIDNEGPAFSDETKNFIRKINFSQQLVIKINSINDSQKIKNLPVVRFKIK